MKIFFHRYVHLVLAIGSLIAMLWSSRLMENQPLKLDAFQSKLHQKELLAKKLLNNLSKIDKNQLLFLFSDQFVHYKKHDDISLYIFNNQQLIFWNNSDIPFDVSLKDFNKPEGIIKLTNGWYQYILKKQDNLSYLSLILIQYLPPIQNQFFSRQFQPSFEINNHFVITKEKTQNAIYNSGGQYLFSLQKEAKHNQLKQNYTWLFLFIFSLIMFISFLSKQLQSISKIKKWTSLIIIISLLIFRIILLVIHPFNRLNIELFSPTIFAQSSLLPSLGDLFIHTITFLIILYYYNRFVKLINPKLKSIALFLGLISALLPILLANLLEGLIRNSNINFDVNYILDLNGYSFIGITSIILLLTSSIIFLKINISHFKNKAFSRNQLIAFYWLFSLLAVIVSHFIFEISFYYTGWILIVIIIFSFTTTPRTSFYRSALLIFIIALTISYGFIHLSKQKDEAKKEFLAKKIANERDPVAEYLFQEIEEKLKKDTLLINHIHNYWNKKNMINQHISDRYFSGYWSKYDVNIIYPCTETDSIYVEDEKKEINCLTFFNEKINRESGNPFGVNKSINFLYSEEGISSYLTKLKIKSQNIDYYLFIELFPKFFSKKEGYPELLLDAKNSATSINTNLYSYAKYKKGKLIENVGDYNYEILMNRTFRFNKEGFCYSTFNNTYHVVYQSDKNTLILFSSPQKTIFNYITTFSYFFIISSLLVLLIGFFMKISPFNWQIGLNNFSTKIQLFVIVSIFLSFILFGLATTYYIKKQNYEKNKTLLKEKGHSVLIELEHKLGKKNTLDKSLYDELTYYLIKFSNVFFTDINLYDKSGMLLASSRPEIFDKGLTGIQMDMDAYRALHFSKKSNFLQKENIGKLNYLSLYTPFRNDKNKILAYINLPYFAKQQELDNELSSFYTSLVNVYGLLFFISAIFAVFFANYISEPVRLIKDKISALQLGKSSELLEWQSNDEIGALVLEYNKKVMELEKSAQLLVQSERESAWREMAKQVAHEIKNPLTPMKLSIQQLQRLAKDENADLSERIKRTSKTLIDQIDTLANIANEFSNFAKMPKAQAKKINLIEILETVIDLYREEKIKFRLINNCVSSVNISADKNQISRMFSNIIKNAIQATPDDKNGKIEIVINDEDDILITIKDNGEGISKDKRDKIFVPNFTTKSTGMGLGLAMVKNIVESANGQVWFETQEGKGTVFYLKFEKMS